MEGWASEEGRLMGQTKERLMEAERLMDFVSGRLTKELVRKMNERLMGLVRGRLMEELVRKMKERLMGRV